jgi:16S rRNA (cytidine1402-2'-O)-methyltransferase
VATPIGNLEDLGFRALRLLKECDWVAAEDTRESRKLLEHYGARPRLFSLHEHSSREKIAELVSLLKGGQAGAYISDAGTPGLCDPGADLVNACVAEGIPVVPVPGPSAVAALLSVSGFKEAAFFFHGFFPREKKEREEWARKAAGGVHLFYESPHRIQESLAFFALRFPSSSMVVGRELTKRFETITRGTCQSVGESLGAEEPRGEYVLALELPKREGEASGLKPEEIRELVKELAQIGASQKVLVRVATSHGMRKNEAYKLALDLLEK